MLSCYDLLQKTVIFLWFCYSLTTCFLSSALKSLVKVDGVKSFTFEEMAAATKKFCNSSQVGQGGYGKVYKGILADGTSVAIKRAQKDSLQGSKEFITEIEFLSRLHHRNLVSMVGYCDEEDEQVLLSINASSLKWHFCYGAHSDGGLKAQVELFFFPFFFIFSL